jgi:hypothetical protein
MPARPACLQRYVKQPWLCLALFLLLLGLDVSAQNGLTATVVWEPSISTNVTSYKVYYGTRSGHYTNSLTVDSATTSAVISGLEEGTTYFFAVTAVAGAASESRFSPEVYVTLPAAPRLIMKTMLDDFGNLYTEILCQQPVARLWIMEYSFDLVSWHGFSSGYSDTIDMLNPIDPGGFPQMFYRLAIY